MYLLHPYRCGLTTCILALLFVCCHGTCVRAQQPISFGTQYTLHSDSLQEDRVLNVLLPQEYQDSVRKQYPVIYLLDGAQGEDFFHVAGLVRYFIAHGMMPPAILVGIANTDRKRDFTYPSTDPRDSQDFPTNGGSARFVGFLQQELVQWVGEHFRTTAHRTLIGQSLGGLLATEMLFRYPGTFKDYIIVSPSLWWDQGELAADFQSLHDALQVVPERLFVAVGEEYPVMVQGGRTLARVFWEEGADTEAIFRYLPAEDHNTILHEALYQAFDHFYDQPVDRRYRFANKWEGLEIREAPNPDAAVVAKLQYGQELGLINKGNAAARINKGAGTQVQGEVDGKVGHWVYIGSDAGVGWVFDAYLSSGRVFLPDEDLATYAYQHLNKVKEMTYENPYSGDAWVRYTIQEDATGNQFVTHDLHVDWAEELRITNITEAQAAVTALNFLQAQGYREAEALSLLTQESIKLIDVDGHEPDQPNLFITYRAARNTLSLYLMHPKNR